MTLLEKGVCQVRPRLSRFVRFPCDNGQNRTQVGTDRRCDARGVKRADNVVCNDGVAMRWGLALDYGAGFIQ